MRFYSKIKKRISKIKKFIYYTDMSRFIFSELKILGVKNIRPLKYKRWHTGFCYFTGNYKNEKVFIKVDTELKFLSNEKIFYDNFSDELEDYLIPLELFKEFSKFQIGIFKYVKESTPINEMFLINNNKLLGEILEILIKINKKNVIHRDIKIDNFMIEDNKLKIIDFTFINSFINKEYKELNITIPEEQEILRELGGWDKISDYEWNDFHALKIIIEKLLTYEAINNNDRSEIIKYLDMTKEFIGNSTYKLE